MFRHISSLFFCISIADLFLTEAFKHTANLLVGGDSCRD